MIIMRNKPLLLLALVSLLVGSSFAGVTFTSYTNNSSWEAATAGWSHYPFLSTPVNQTQNPGTSFSSDAGSFGAPRGVFAGTYDQVWTDRVTEAGSEATTWWITGLDMQAFGGYWDFSPGGNGQGLTLTITLYGLGSQHVFDICGDPVCAGSGAISVPNGSWFGVVGDGPFLAMSITADHQPGVAETYDLAGLDLARVSTPEPATLTLLGTGLLGLAGLLRRRR